MTTLQNAGADQLTDGLMGDFLDESTDIMRRLNEGLLQLDQAVKSGVAPHASDEELLNGMFRAAHSLKGLSGMLGLRDLNALVHKVENVFDAIRNGRLGITGNVVDISFQAVDRLDAMIELLKCGDQASVDYGSVLERIDDVLSARDLDAETNAIENPTAPVDAAVVERRDEADPLSGIEDDVDVPTKYLGIFVDECELTLDSLSDSLLQTVDAAGAESLLVGCHRLKGSAASIGLRRVARLAHLMEDLLQDLRRREQLPTADMTEALLKSVDDIRAYIHRLRKGDRSTEGLANACRQMLQISTPIEDEALKPADAATSQDALRRHLDAAAASLPQGTTGFAGYVHFEPGLALPELKARLLIKKLLRLGTLHFISPTEDELEAGDPIAQLVFGIVSDAADDVLRAELRISGITRIELIEVTRPSVPPTAASEIGLERKSDSPAVSPASTPASSVSGNSVNDTKSKPTETLRVDIERLDQLMNLAGQLVITKARFSQIGQGLKRLHSGKQVTASLADAVIEVNRLSTELRNETDDRRSDRDALIAKTVQIQDDLAVVQRDLHRFYEVRSLLNELAEAVHQLDRVADGIQSSVMDTRMVPIGPLFSRFKRVVRDLGRAGGKEIHLDIRGEHTELDKRMIDELGDPLIHLIRNSADHGLEGPEGRSAAGKPPQGTITLNAFHRGNRIVIQVSDDGRGLDVARIRAKAVAKGWMSEADADKLTDAQVHQLIWRPGFSTAEKVTEVSGRGMGMDIVWSKIEQLNGTIELTSQAGRGTTFEIMLPLTMAILPSLLMVIGRDVFAVPVESVVEIARIPTESVATVYGSPTARIRGRVISLVHLGDLFGDPQQKGPIERPSNTTIVIVGSEGSEIGIVVDDLLGEQDVVIKSLAENFQNISGIAGASILGDGRVSLILDVAALLQMACRQAVAADSLVSN